jgi:hypothetical protein
MTRSTSIITLRALALGLLFSCAAGCTRERLAASGPIKLDTQPKEILFTRTYSGSGLLRVLIYVFEHAPDSDHASKIHAALIREDGRQEILSIPYVTRRDESIIRVSYLVAKVDARPRADEVVSYKGVELWSEVPVELREIRWPKDPKWPKR